MNPLRCSLIAILLFLAVEGSVAQKSGFGLGVIFGERTGVSAKVWTSSMNAFNFGLGWSIGGDRIGKYKGY